MKKCPYCAEEIQDEAILCRYCGKEVGEGAIKESEKRTEVAKQIAFIERDITKLQGELAETDQKLQQTRKGQGTAGLMGLIGFLLIPVGIGIILIIVAVVGIIAVPGEIRKLEELKQQQQTQLDLLLNQLADLKAEHAGL